jgi:putative transcriptional regulator
MTKENTIRAKRLADGSFVQVLPDGTTRPFPPDQTDWAALRAMTDDEINAAALDDPDNPPITLERQARLKRVPQVKVMRRALRLTQEEFSARFRIPLGTLRDWEQGKSEPDQAARALSHSYRPRSGSRAQSARGACSLSVTKYDPPTRSGRGNA